jgi:hypothetical protein
MDANRKNWLLVLGVAIPVIAVIAVAASIYVPQFFVHPKYNFVYGEIQSDMTYPPCMGTGITFSVVNGKVVEHQPAPAAALSVPQPVVCSSSQDEKIYLYNVSSNTSTELTASGAQSYTLDTDAASPDGFTVGPAYGNGGSLFFSAPYSSNVVYISKGTYSHRLNIEVPNGSTSSNFQLLGWVTN